MFLEDIADKLSPIETKASSLFQNATEKASSLDDYVLDSISDSVVSRLDAWLIQHPFIYWSVNHPIISLIGGLITIILTIRLLATIYRALAKMIDRMWLWILRSPWLLLKFFFGWEKKPKIPPNSIITNYEVTNNPEQLQEIMTRLDKIQQQQEQILQDLALLKQQPHSIETKHIKLTTKSIIANKQ